MTSKSTDQIPAYEELFEQRPQNKRTGYSNIPATDPEIDLENQTHIHEYSSPAQGQEQGYALGQTSSSSGAGIQPAREHFHCETCEIQRERREKREAEHRHCQTVSKTFLLLALMMTIILIVVVPSVTAIVKRRRY